MAPLHPRQSEERSVLFAVASALVVHQQLLDYEEPDPKMVELAVCQAARARAAPQGEGTPASWGPVDQTHPQQMRLLFKQVSFSFSLFLT